MKIRLTVNGRALVEMMRSGSGLIHTEAHRPRMREYTLIRLDRKGQAISKEKVLVDESRYFRAA